MPRPLLPALLVLVAAASSLPSIAHAGGFEVGENTTQSVARGGTGVALKRDPSALYFNPALLPRARGFQVLLNSNFVDMDMTYQRDPFGYTRGSRTVDRTYDEVENAANFFPAPFLTLSWDLGIENFALALGVFGPSAYGRSCYGEIADDGSCQLRANAEGAFEGDTQTDANAARYMMIESQLLEIYFTLGAGYTFDLGESELSVGLAGAAAYQRNTFELAIDSTFPVSPPWREEPEQEAIFRAENLQDLKPTGFFGLAWRRGGATLAMSYRPPIYWEAEGTVTMDLPETLQEVSEAELTDDRVIFRTWQAGSLRAGFGWEEGTHPRFADRPRLSLEANVVWEDWSRVETFEVETTGNLQLLGQEQELNAIEQDKSWQDTFSLRLGGSWAFNRWVTAHLGGYMETATQAYAYTNADFVAWERYGAGGGATVHATDWLDFELAYMYIGMPDRTVGRGDVYSAVPLSSCQPPYEDSACEEPGTPPGNPQNEGQWSARFQTASVGLTLHFE